MSGWIRIEKDLATTMRFRRVVRAVKESNALRGVTNCDDSFVTTLVIGALARFWTYADSHITDDNTLAITLDEIDDLVGVQGFAKALPADWLQVIDADNVKLPDFLEHNGTSAKQRKDAARRQATYRKRHHHSNVTQESRVTNARNGARPDQDQTRPRLETQERARDVPHGTFNAYEFIDRRMRPAYPRGTYLQAHWQNAERTLERLVIEDGENPDEILAGVERYARQQQAEGNVGTKFICNPDKFLAEARYTEPFPMAAPAVPIDPKKLAAQITEAREWSDLKSRGEKAGFRQPIEGESMGAYRTLLQRHEYDNPVRATA